MLSFAYENHPDTIMTLPSIAIAVFGKTRQEKREVVELILPVPHQ